MVILHEWQACHKTYAQAYSLSLPRQLRFFNWIFSSLYNYELDALLSHDSSDDGLRVEIYMIKIQFRGFSWLFSRKLF